MAAFFNAATYISAAVISGAALTRLFWSRSRTTSSLSLFTIASAIGWIWIPSVVLLSRQRSIAAALLAVVVAALMASGLRKVVPPGTAIPAHGRLGEQWKETELFAEYLKPAPREIHAFIIAVCWYAGLFALHKQWLVAASFLLALCAFLLTWKLRGDNAYASLRAENTKHAALRLARASSGAVLITTALLLLGLPHGAFPRATNAYARDRSSSGRRVPPQHEGDKNPAPDLSGYERIILWPIPEKKKVVMTAPSRALRAGFSTNKPVTIRFDGSYWYFQPRGIGPGTRAHVARGSPLTVDIRSINHIPLIMEAHQSLAAPIPLRCCGELQVTIENHDNAPGIVALGVLLTDSTSLGKPTLYLDQRPIPSTEPGRFGVKSSPIPEVLSFSIPTHAKIQQFDEITVIFFPDSERPYSGTKIAIKQFDLIPH
jgi:hypothetical protein